MPFTTLEFLTEYSSGIHQQPADAYRYAVGSWHDNTQEFQKLTTGDHLSQMRQNIWKYGENGILQHVPADDCDDVNLVENMVNGTIYLLPGIDENQQPDFSKMYTMTATKHDGTYYVQIMDPAQAKEAFENKPVKAPDFIDRVINFFCKLFGSRGTVCALWDAANNFANNMNTFAKEAPLYQGPNFQNELLDADFSRAEKQLSDDEKAQRVQQGKKLVETRIVKYDENLTDWYLALYANSHDMFPVFISNEAEIQMTEMDQQALAFAAGKFTYEGKNSYRRNEELVSIHKGFDVRANIVTTMAFALSADMNMSAEDVFDVLAGKEVAGGDALKAALQEQINNYNLASKRNSDEMKALLQKGTTRMCNLLENRENLQDGISYQLGRTIHRNQVVFTAGRFNDTSVDLQISPVAKRIVKLQDDIINSYNADIMEAYVRYGSSEKDLGATATSLSATGLLPINVLGQTNAAFLQKLSQQPANQRAVFLKANLHTLEDMNENLTNFIQQRLQEENCTWLATYEKLKEALNGAVVKEYHEAITKALKETGKKPVYKGAIDNLMENDNSFMIDNEYLDARDAKKGKQENNKNKQEISLM